MLGLLATAMAIGIGTGYAAGGSLPNMANVRVRWAPLLFCSLVVGVVPLLADLDGGARFAIQMLSHAGLLVFFGVNIARARAWLRIGFVVVAIGWALNVLAISSNGGMPVSLWALERADITEEFTPGTGSFFRVEPAGPHTNLRVLGDVIPIPHPFRQVISIGDILLVGGIAMIVTAGMRARLTRTLPHVVDLTLAEKLERARLGID
ncbi:MAG TPA: DUF5317 family protein [Actinomycetota bacterium]|nr:DUF5317 family protein [Actinomycetota bacterium]